MKHVEIKEIVKTEEFVTYSCDFKKCDEKINYWNQLKQIGDKDYCYKHYQIVSWEKQKNCQHYFLEKQSYCRWYWKEEVEFRIIVRCNKCSLEFKIINGLVYKTNSSIWTDNFTEDEQKGKSKIKNFAPKIEAFINEKIKAYVEIVSNNAKTLLEEYETKTNIKEIE